jgi:branched-chain amino acid transport system ATP-binding protein
MMLVVRGLRANYGRIPILNGIDVDVADREVVGILGHNGMGKTTLMRTLMGFVPSVGGSVTFDGRDITGEPPHRRVRRGIGYVPQGREIFPRLSVRDNLRMAALATGKDEATVEEVLADFSRLRPLLDRQGGALSGGEQQILAIARCLCTRPRLILLDEPTEGIQPSIVQQIAETLLGLKSARGLTMVLVEQHLEFVAALSDRVLVLQKGAIVQELAASRLSDVDVVHEIVGMGAAPASGR